MSGGPPQHEARLIPPHLERVIPMNTATRLLLTAAAVATVGVTTTLPAGAAQPRGPESGTVTAAVSPYAEPLEALGGRTLAQYLAAHHGRRFPG